MLPRKKKEPVADIVAIIVNDNNEPMFIPIGMLWQSRKGNLSGSIDSEPVQWVAGKERRISIRPKDGVRISIQDPRVPHRKLEGEEEVMYLGEPHYVENE